MSLQRVAIIGAGVAGLVAALSFARKGVSCDVIEQAAELTEVGAGLQLSPNATRILGYLGVLPALEKEWTAPQSIDLASGLSLRTLTRIETGQNAVDRWQAPYAVLHRATLQRLLLEAVQSTPSCRLFLGHRVESASVEAITAITGATPQLIIGADGVWSPTREVVAGHGNPKFSGFVAWRFVIPEAAAPDFLPKDRVTAFVGPDAHLVSYPLKDTSGHNLVALIKGDNPGQTWLVKPEKMAQTSMVEKNFSRWHPAIRGLLSGAENPTWWPLFGVSDGKWTDGRHLALVGDAAHAMLPFAAQGAVMAIEDSYRLASLACSLPLPAALATYETERSTRVAKVRARGDFNRFAYHARGPIRLARNAVFALTPPSQLAAGLDWIYGYNAGE